MMNNNSTTYLYLLFVFVVGIANSQTVTIGNQTWMTKNLDVSTFRNGDTIPEIQDVNEWHKAGEEGRPAWCYYDNDSTYGTTFGKLYNWYAVNDPRGLAPVGYHIPSDQEWTMLTDYLGLNAGSKMKSVPILKTYVTYKEVGGYYETKWVPCSNCSYWTEKQRANNPCSVCRNEGGKTIKGKYIPKTKKKITTEYNIGWNGTNESGFDALDYCFRNEYAGWITEQGFDASRTKWWSSTIDKYDVILCRGLGSGPDVEVVYSGTEDSQGMYVRCIKDTTE